MRAIPLVKQYLIGLLQDFMFTERLFDQEMENGHKTRPTLAEIFLKAMNAKDPERTQLLKKLGDTSLYVGGFFGDSLQRKVVDVDYYVQMGGAAYNNLSVYVKEDTFKRVYEELSSQFIAYIDVLTYISQKAQLHSNENILRIYENYLRTGSDLAKEQLIEKGILQLPKVGGIKEFKQ